jgi:hypothetical protein
MSAITFSTSVEKEEDEKGVWVKVFSFWIMRWLRVDYAEGQVFALYEILGCGRKGFWEKWF